MKASSELKILQHPGFETGVVGNEFCLIPNNLGLQLASLMICYAAQCQLFEISNLLVEIHMPYNSPLRPCSVSVPFPTKLMIVLISD